MIWRIRLGVKVVIGAFTVPAVASITLEEHTDEYDDVEPKRDCSFHPLCPINLDHSMCRHSQSPLNETDLG